MKITPILTASLALWLTVGCGPVASDQETRLAPPAGVAGDGGATLEQDGGDSLDVAAGVPDDPGPVFIAFQRDFQNFKAWPRFVIANTAAPVDASAHQAGQRIVYINPMPTAGRRTFIGGTIIVKTLEGGETFAAVKRGGTFNKSGAKGWEWFELKLVDSEWVIVWRGITPPIGEGYSGAAGGTCNDCHIGFSANDYVGTPALDLKRFR